MPRLQLHLNFKREIQRIQRFALGVDFLWAKRPKNQPLSPQNESLFRSRGNTLLVIAMMGVLVWFLTGWLTPSITTDFVARSQTPPSPTGSRIAVANRGSNTVTLIDVEAEEKLQIELEPGSEPMYAQNPFFSNEIWIGDRANNRVLVYDALRLRRIAEIPTGKGVFHMWNNNTLGQMWVVCDIDKTLTVISLRTKQVLATVPIPRDLAIEFKPHDVTVTATSAIVSLIGAPGNPDGWLVNFSGKSFKEVSRRKVSGDPHLMYWGFSRSSLYVVSQVGDKVLRLNPRTLAITGELDIPGAHGIWANEAETRLFVGNIESADGRNSIYTIDIPTFSIMPGSPANAALPFPHNFMVSIDSSKLFITHSNQGSEFTSVYDLDANGIPVASRLIETGPVPFGIMLIRDPVCLSNLQ
jgi:DNA-binding beta-propeller fold protein YncE